MAADERPILVLMEFAGDRCIVRPWRIADVAPLAKHANNANVARQLRDRFPHPYTAGDARHFIQSVLGARTPTVFAIVVDGEPVGGVGISPGADVERFSAEIGYWLGEAFWGRGIATDAVRLVSGYAFDTCNMLRLFALPFADNLQSIRVLEKAGYTREALLRASSVKNGEVRDQAIYALVNAQWRGV
jgi:ribosomal-protein-alanine N-acetyltransferase